MKHEVIPPVKRRATNVTLPEDLVAQARELGVNVSKACQTGLSAAVRLEREQRWREEHCERIDAFSDWFERNGMPFEELRVF